MEEFESTAVQSSRVTIKKMEVRIEELETLLHREKQMHIEATTALHKRDRSVKELLLQSEEDRKNILILQESLDKLNEKIKMYKRQLEEQESISNSNIMRVKKFQRELESAESRACEAESSLDAFRSRQRVYASAANTRCCDELDCDGTGSVEREIVVKKTVQNVNVSNINERSLAINNASSSSAAAARASASRGYSSSAAMASSASDAYRAGSSVRELRAGSTLGDYRSSAAGQYRTAGTSYSRAGSLARSSMARATSVGRAGSVLRY